MSVIHFNENCSRDEAKTKDGELRYDVVLPKYKRGQYVVKKVLVDCTYGQYTCCVSTRAN